jgi:hypothetical protein
MVLCLHSAVGVFELLFQYGLPVGFNVFYPGTEGGGVGRTVPLSLATELVIYSRCVCLQGRQVCNDIPACRSYRYISQLGVNVDFR